MSGYVRPKGLVVLRCVLVVLALVLGASTLSACGDAEGAGSAEDGVSKDVPGLPDGTPVRVIEDVDHEQVIVPADPQRVVTLSEPTLDGALTLGVKPVGTVNGRGQSSVPHYIKDLAEGIPAVGSVAEFNFEAIGKLKPDLILTYASGGNNPAPSSTGPMTRWRSTSSRSCGCRGR